MDIAKTVRGKHLLRHTGQGLGLPQVTATETWRQGYRRRCATKGEVRTMRDPMPNPLLLLDCSADGSTKA
jgi:hypothetical protein